MKYIVETRVNGVTVDKQGIIADSPKRAVISAVNYLLRARKIDMVEVYVGNSEGRLWEYLIHISHDNRKLEIVREKKLQ